MGRQETLAQVKESFGLIPGLIEQMPDQVLEQYWGTLTWVMGDTSLTARDKALVAFGAASAIHCPY